MNRRTLCFVAFFSFISLALVASQGSNGFSDPCWQKFCHIYAKCVKNGTDAVCVCPQNCSKGRIPVCGTDWKTYDNMCELMATSCKNNGLTRLRYQGECETGSCRKTQWASMIRCPYYSKCFLNKGLPTCACPKWKCSPTYEPVCGSNGKTYINICHLRKAGCKTRTWLSVKRMGHCLPDPCNALNCCCGAVCRINATSQATCQCNIACTDQIDLVCGSDGNTYKSPCDLRLAACTQQNPTLVAATRGPCPTAKPTSPPSPCDLIKCAFYATCQAHLGMAKCTCPNDCQDAPPNVVCGDDGITYQNICELTKASCTTQTRIKVASNGVCLIPAPVSPCSSVRCPKYASCTVVEGRARCVCARSCPSGGTPVCGSDGITYTNECNLKKTSCEYSKNTTLVKFGPCDPSPNSPCFLVECLYYSKCLVNQTYAICVCPSNCPVSGENQVCGSDFITYDNECILRRTACLYKKNITVAHVGPCGVPSTPSPMNACNGRKCQHYATCKEVNGQPSCVCPNDCMVFSAQIPVCGSDGITYPSNCDLQIQSCRQQKPVSLVKMGICGGSTSKQGTLMGTCSDGKCGYYATCEVDGVGGIRCVCPRSCPDVYEPVCDQHGINHKNQCQLKATSCKNQREITITKKGVCESKRCPVPKGCFSFCETPIWIAGRLVCPPKPLVCLNDDECTGGKICCRDGCTRKCVLPRQ